MINITHLISDFERWTGKGNLIQANNVASRIFTELAKYLPEAETEEADADAVAVADLGLAPKTFLVEPAPVADPVIIEPAPVIPTVAAKPARAKPAPAKTGDE